MTRLLVLIALLLTTATATAQSSLEARRAEVFAAERAFARSMADRDFAAFGRHVAEAESRCPLLGVTVIHRHGRLAPGDNIVLVVTASMHREAAFAAAEFLMDYLKTQAPFWKLEERASGKSWVESKTSDDASADRWRRG